MIASARIVASVLQHRLHQPRRGFSGNAESILRVTLDHLWNGRFYRAALGNYRQFWMRDFGIALPGILAFGKRDQAYASLNFALAAYRRRGRITTIIFPSGRASDLPGPGIDSLGWLLASLRLLGATDLVTSYRELLDDELERIRVSVLNDQGFPLHAIPSIGLRDHIRYRASCYDAAIAWRLADDAQSLGLKVLPRCTPQAFLDRYWTGSFYREDVNDPPQWSAEANLVPFWFGLDTDASRFRAATRIIWEEGLDRPVPLAYATERHQREIWQARLFSPNSHGTCRWPILGVIFAECLRRFGDPRAADIRQRLLAAVERFGFFPELLTPQGDLYRSLWYKSDIGMLWASRLQMN